MRIPVMTKRTSSIPYNQILVWIEENIKGEVKYVSSDDKRYWIWYFSNPKEATLFALMWTR